MYAKLSVILLVFIIIISILFYTFRIPYKVLELDNLLTDEECDTLILYAKERGLIESSVLSNDIDKETQYDVKNRLSKTLWIKDDEHRIAMKVALLTEKLTKLPIHNQESLQIAHYDKGGKFNPHYDACNTGTQEYRNKINRNAGQRRATLLIYLNDDYEGGETIFNNIHLTITPKKGKGILFWNTNAKEDIILDSLHCGKEVKKGEKWICTKWTHAHKYPI